MVGYGAKNTAIETTGAIFPHIATQAGNAAAIGGGTIAAAFESAGRSIVFD